jgi:hypothetical protein
VIEGEESVALDVDEVGREPRVAHDVDAVAGDRFVELGARARVLLEAQSGRVLQVHDDGDNVRQAQSDALGVHVLFVREGIGVADLDGLAEVLVRTLTELLQEGVDAIGHTPSLGAPTAHNSASMKVVRS